MYKGQNSLKFHQRYRNENIITIYKLNNFINITALYLYIIMYNIFVYMFSLVFDLPEFFYIIYY